MKYLAYSEKRKILFTGGGGAAAESIQEQWGNRYDLYFGDADPHRFSPKIPEDHRQVIPFADDPGFEAGLLSVCHGRAIDLIVPGVDEELLPLARKHGAPGWPRILLPDERFVGLMLDKLACAQALDAAGLRLPRTLPLERAGEIGFPLIAKPRSGRGSRGVLRLDRPEQVGAYLALNSGPPANYIAQELILGDEFTVFVAADGGGAPNAIIPVYVQEKRGITLRAEVRNVPEILRYAQAFQACFRPSGCYNIQCVLTADGLVLPFEVNPRISTTFVLAIATGFDPIPSAMGEGPEGPTFVPDGGWSLQRTWHTQIVKMGAV